MATSKTHELFLNYTQQKKYFEIYITFDKWTQKCNYMYFIKAKKKIKTEPKPAKIGKNQVE